ncbi:hypothetical protein SPB21_16585 [Leptothoe sp. ISB3NOV94-8A]|uniref:Uncharacterized protein n=2 Tax=Adonisia turfae TaxID=2950184 RepID=A0A6M0RN03_9CYAN|nr:hypothetical protein [Adonisia turfae]MDV3352583.1 hypothetical protein [Leptothoe sp. LEGE 181152]NEZ57240.1 hypothetical protein [Adonisia turfae CCMR0081]
MMMLFDRGNRSADNLYLDARKRWTRVVSLSIHDSEDMLHSVERLLQKARRQNSRHVPSLVLLSDVLMALGSTQNAMEIVDSLIAIEPGNDTHVQKKALLERLQVTANYDNREAIWEFIEARWTQTSDW